MSPSLDNHYTIQDLVFQVLKIFGLNNFNTRCLSRIKHFMTWSSKTWTTEMNMIVKTWHPKFWNVSIFATPCPKSWPWLQYSRLCFPSLETFGVNNSNTKRLLKMSFMTQDLVFQDWICFRALAATTVLYVHIYTYVSKLGIPSVETFHFLQLHVSKSWQWLHYSRLGFSSLESFLG